MIGFEVNRGRRGIRRGEVLSFDPATWKAWVTLDGSLSAVELPAARGLMAALTPGTRVAVILFDENNPADGLIVGVYSQAAPYTFSRRTFVANDFANHKAGFEANTAASSPFSITTPANSYAVSYTANPHWLTLRNWHATDPLYLQWASATAKTHVDVIWAATPNAAAIGAADQLIAEFRFWGVESPAGNESTGDYYYAVRMMWRANSQPQYPPTIEYWYGRGTVFLQAGTGGTKASGGPFIPGMVYQEDFDVTAGPAFGTGTYNFVEGFGAGGAAMGPAGWPASFKCVRFYNPGFFNYLYLDQVVVT